MKHGQRKIQPAEQAQAFYHFEIKKRVIFLSPMELCRDIQLFSKARDKCLKNPKQHLNNTVIM